MYTIVVHLSVEAVINFTLGHKHYILQMTGPDRVSFASSGLKKEKKLFFSSEIFQLFLTVILLVG